MKAKHKNVIDYAVWMHNEVAQDPFKMPLKDVGHGIKTRDYTTLGNLNTEVPSLEDVHEVYCNLIEKAPEARNLTGAYLSFLGFLNPRSQKKKLRKYARTIAQKDYEKIVFAEGDSWLEYPLFIHEITDQLIKTKKYAVYSDAYGGDWIADIVNRKTQFLELFKEVKPHALLLSGGGNDIVGRENARQKESPVNTVLFSKIKQGINNDEGLDLTTAVGKIAFGEKCFSTDFDELLALIYVQYNFMIQKINRENLRDNFKILLHGYDYAIPSSQKGFGWNPLRIMKPISNLFLNNGTWLKAPLEAAGYTNNEEQEAIIYYMIERFNETLLEITNCATNVYFIDCRNSVNPQKGWYNELHPTSRAFKEIAKAFQWCIDTDSEKRHIKAVDFLGK